jgi:hypothetical protein
LDTKAKLVLNKVKEWVKSITLHLTKEQKIGKGDVVGLKASLIISERNVDASFCYLLSTEQIVHLY